MLILFFLVSFSLCIVCLFSLILFYFYLYLLFFFFFLSHSASLSLFASFGQTRLPGFMSLRQMASSPHDLQIPTPGCPSSELMVSSFSRLPRCPSIECGSFLPFSRPRTGDPGPASGNGFQPTPGGPARSPCANVRRTLATGGFKKTLLAPLAFDSHLASMKLKSFHADPGEDHSIGSWPARALRGMDSGHQWALLCMLHAIQNSSYL